MLKNKGINYYKERSSQKLPLTLIIIYLFIDKSQIQDQLITIQGKTKQPATKKVKVYLQYKQKALSYLYTTYFYFNLDNSTNH